MGTIITWLFTDPVSAGVSTPGGKPEVFHFYLPWVLFCTLALLVPFYYFQEGRKRFFGGHALHKYLLDRFFSQLWPIGLVGFILLAMRYGLDSSLFAWRFWRYGWALWAVGIFLYWAYYLSFRYKGQLEAYRLQRQRDRYVPQPRNRRRPARAGARS